MNKQKISIVTDYKCGYTTILARPNTGKSTLLNYIAGQKIAITTPVAQTTRKQIKAVYTDKTAQIIFTDTPGIHKPENKLGEYLLYQSSAALKDCDVVIFMADAAQPAGRGDIWIVQNFINTVNKPVIIALNKIDTAKNIEKNIKTYQNLFDKACPLVQICALNGKNVPLLIDKVKEFLPCSMPYYDKDEITDQNMRQIAQEIIREKIILNTKEEIPHCAAVLIDEYKTQNNMDKIKAVIYVSTQSQKGIIIGTCGNLLKKIGTQARIELEEITGTKVFLQLFVKVKKNWQKDENSLKLLGYEK